MKTKIEEERNKLYKTITKNGINSAKTIKMSKDLNNLIVQYYSEFAEELYIQEQVAKKECKKTYEDLYEQYLIAKTKLKELYIQNKKFPTVEEWNRYAKKYNYLNNVTMEYISKQSWHDLRYIISNSCKEKS